MKTARTLTRVLVFLLVCFTLLRLTGAEQGTIPILLVGMFPLTMLPAYPALLVAAVCRDRVAALAAVAVIAVHLAICLPRLQAEPISEAARSAPTLTVATANLFVDNLRPLEVAAAVRDLGADVVVVPELSGPGLEALREAGTLAALPYVVQIPGTGPETTGLLSRLPVTDVRVERFAGRGQPEVTVSVAGVDVRILGFHAQPALSVFEAPWRAGLGRLTDLVRATDLPVVLAGDLNATLDNGAMRPLLGTGLRDAHAERGRGLTATWPAALPLTAYDHVLVRDGAAARLEVLEVHEADLPGSDHLAVVATIAVVAGG